nr:hypothetical protein [Actinoplanes italicus]
MPISPAPPQPAGGIGHLLPQDGERVTLDMHAGNAPTGELSHSDIAPGRQHPYAILTPPAMIALRQPGDSQATSERGDHPQIPMWSRKATPVNRQRAEGASVLSAVRQLQPYPQPAPLFRSLPVLRLWDEAAFRCHEVVPRMSLFHPA